MSIPVISTEETRRALAGLADPDRSPGESESVEIKDALHRFGCVLAHLFGDELDRIKLWDRIGSAFASACAKVDDGDLDRFATLCLDHVQADPGEAARCGPLNQLLSTFAVRPIEWRQAFVRHARTHYYSVLSHSKARWEQVKSKGVEL